MRVKRSDFQALLDASYTGKPPTTPGVWDGDVPAPVAPGEHEEREVAAPRDPGGAREAEPDEAAEKPPG